MISRELHELAREVDYRLSHRWGDSWICVEWKVQGEWRYQYRTKSVKTIRRDIERMKARKFDPEIQGYINR